ncbi:MAG: IS3 family transposase [Geobacillus sp.]|nr:MAG: IS3 family transposase [Geobacillus sp.]
MAKMCEVLGISRSGYYAWTKRPESQQKERQEALKKQIKKIHIESRETYGSPKITKILQKQGVEVSPKTVARIMKDGDIRSKTKKKYKATTNSKHHWPVYPNLLNQQFEVNEPNQVWVADITYIWTKEGWLYLASIMDLFSRKIVGWYLSERMTKELVIQAFHRAIHQRNPQPGLIHHSDQGSQYASNEYQAMLRQYGIQTSMSRKGNCYDNACAESFHSILKKELIFHETFTTREEAKQRIFEYLECFYNAQRIHSANGYMSPMEYEKMHQQGKKQQRFSPQVTI